MKSGVRFQLTQLHDKRAIYAFRVGRVVKYVGVCEKPNTTLKTRMNRYQAMAGSGTNERIASEIKSALQRNKKVNIMALVPKTKVHHRGITIDLVKGLEYPLIEKIRDGWNVHR